MEAGFHCNVMQIYFDHSQVHIIRKEFSKGIILIFAQPRVLPFALLKAFWESLSFDEILLIAITAC